MKISKGQGVFTGTTEQTVYNLAGRKNYSSSMEVITVWELNIDRSRYETVQLNELQALDGDQV